MRVALIFGGKSSEHSVSVATAVTAYDALFRNHDVVPVYIDKNGVWRKGRTNRKPQIKNLIKGKKLKLDFENHCFLQGFRKIRIDCALLCLHGVNGEDGAVQGALKLASIPFTGCDITSSAVGMDKVFMKSVFKANAIPHVDYLSVTSEEYSHCAEQTKIKALKLGFPLIIKPASCGSSIGISIAKNGKELDKSLKLALRYDNKAIVEKALADFTEVNCAVLKSSERHFVSAIEKPTKKGEILDYIDKYSLSSNHAKREIPAKIEASLAQKVRELALKTFRALDCSGVARIDFLISKEGEVFVNEINTIPGSLSFYLFVGVLSP